MRSFEQLGWFARHVDQLYIFNNSTGEPELIGALKEPYLFQFHPFPDDLRNALGVAGIEMPRLNNPDTWHLL